MRLICSAMLILHSALAVAQTSQQLGPCVAEENEVLSFSLKSLIGNFRADSEWRAPKPPLHSPYWVDGVRIAPLSPELKSESFLSDPFLTKEEICYIGVRNNRPQTTLFHAAVGKKQDRFIIPVTEKPEKILEPGDILIYARSTPADSNRIYDHVTRGAWHVALVTKDKSGKLMHQDSPSSMSGSNFENGMFHIVRLRKYPREVTSEQELKRWQIDPEKKKKLAEWDAKRAAILKDVQRYSLSLDESGYTYDTERVTEISDPKKLRDLKKAFDNKEKVTTCLYCSELPATVFALSGVKPPKSTSLMESLERVEKTVLPKIIESSPGATKEEKLQNAVYRMFQDEGVLRELGATTSEMNQFRKDGTLPKSLKKTADQVTMLLKLSPSQRRMAMATQEMFSKGKGELVGPADWMDAMYGSESDFDYVATYVGRYCQNLGQSAFPAEALGSGDAISDEAISRHEQHLKSVSHHLLSIETLEISRDGNYLLTKSSDKTAKILNLATGEEKKITHGDSVYRAQFSHDGKFVLSTGEDATVKILNLATGAVKEIAHTGRVFSTELSPDGRFAASASQDKTAVILNLATGETKQITHDAMVFSAKFSPDGKFVVTASYDKTAKILNVATGEEKKITHDGAVYSSEFSPDGKYVMTIGQDKTVKILNVKTGDEKKITHINSLNGAWFSSDSKFVVTASADHTAKILNLTTGEEKKITHTNGVISAQFSSDGKYVVTASHDKTAKILNLATGEEKKITHHAPVISAEFSSNSKFVLTRAQYNIVKILNIATGEERKITHTGSVLSADFSPDAKFVLTTGEDRTAKILNLTTGEEKKITHNSPVYRGRFSPDSKWVSTADESGKVLFHAIETVTIETLRKELRIYDSNLYTDNNRTQQIQQRTYLALLFSKAKEKGMTSSQAQKLIREIVSNLSYREDDGHLGGLLKTIWPATSVR